MIHTFLNVQQIMDKSYEVFLGGPTKAAQDKVHVTINSQNVIAINGNCYRLMGKPAAVSLAFSRELQTIAMAPCSPRLNEAFPVLTKSVSGWRVNAAPFCRHFNIDILLKFIRPEPESSALILKLRETVSVGGKRGMEWRNGVTPAILAP